MMRGDGMNVLILSYCCVCFVAIFCCLSFMFAIDVLALLTNPMYSLLYFDLDNQHGCIPPALNPRHVQHQVTIQAPAAKVHDPSIVATLPALSADQHRAFSPPHRAL
jgi:hypothetical protein